MQIIDRMDQIIAHLQKDKRLAKVLETVQLNPLPRRNDHYFVLMKSIASQQLSTKAAETIWNRFLDLFPDRYPYAELVLNTPMESMRGAGMSGQKSNYLKNIAEFSQTNPMTDAHLDGMSDEDIIAYLSSIKGVGKWTVEMLLMFGLGRPNVFPIDDLGVRQGMIKVYGIQSEGKEQRAEMEKIAQKWAPYRSYGCLAMWRWKDGD